jgi:hypothetical protein
MQRTAAVVEISRKFRNKNREYVENKIKNLKQTVRTGILETYRGQGKAILVQA